MDPHLREKARFVAMWNASATILVHSETPAGDLAAECGLLEVDEARCAFEISERLRPAGGEALEFPARCDLELQRVHELRIVALQYPEERRHVAGDVIDDLGLRLSVAPEEHAAHAEERFRVAIVGCIVDQGDDPLCQQLLAADIGGRRGDRIDWG